MNKVAGEGVLSSFVVYCSFSFSSLRFQVVSFHPISPLRIPFYTYVLSTVLYSPSSAFALVSLSCAHDVNSKHLFPTGTGFSCGGLGFRCSSLALGSDVDGSPLSRLSIKKKRNRHYAVAVPPERADPFLTRSLYIQCSAWFICRPLWWYVDSRAANSLRDSRRHRLGQR